MEATIMENQMEKKENTSWKLGFMWAASGYSGNFTASIAELKRTGSGATFLNS